MIHILVSACLLGQRVRYDGRVMPFHDEILTRWHREGRLVPFCPEVAAGLPVPRPPFEIRSGGGGDVLAGAARVHDARGGDATAAFIAGAQATLQAALNRRVRLAVMKDGSPSCGSRVIHDGKFLGRKVPGVGVAAALLARNGVWVFPETQIVRAAEALSRMEACGEKGTARSAPNDSSIQVQPTTERE